MGLKALHDLNVIHRGVCAENIYFFEEKVKIIDHANSVFLTKKEVDRTSRHDNFGNSAPEILERGGRYGKAVDVWSLGVLAYKLATGHAPYREDMRVSQVF